jgi:hypothetical protein
MIWSCIWWFSQVLLKVFWLCLGGRAHRGTKEHSGFVGRKLGQVTLGNGVIVFALTSSSVAASTETIARDSATSLSRLRCSCSDIFSAENSRCRRNQGEVFFPVFNCGSTLFPIVDALEQQPAQQRQQLKLPHSLTHSNTLSLTPSATHSFTHSLTLIHSFTH